MLRLLSMESLFQALSFQHVFPSQQSKEERQGGGGSKTLSIGVVNEALTQPFFAAYCQMMRSLTDTLLHIDHWTESCPCKHPGDKISDSTLPSSKMCGAQCPLKGLRVPEMASGTLHTLLDSLFNVSLGSLLLSPDMQACNISLAESATVNL